MASPAFKIGNIYAPPFFALSPSLAGYDDIEFDLDLPAVTIPAASVVLASPTNGQQLLLDSDYDYLVREFQFVVLPVADVSYQPSDLRVRIRDVFGRLVTSDFVQVQNLNGPQAIVWGLKKGGTVQFDFQNVNASESITVQPVFKGWKRKACPGKPAISNDYVPMRQRYARPINPGAALQDFEYYFTFTSTGAQDLLRQPLQTDSDADFLWRGTQGDWNCINNDVAAVGSVGLTFYTPDGRRMTVQGTTNPWGSGNVGQFRESILSSGGGMYAPQYPEILIPKNGVIEVDISFGGAATLRFSLRGLKVYRENC